MKSVVIVMWIVCLSFAFGENQRKAMHMQYTKDAYCSKFVLKDTTAPSGLLCAGKCKSDVKCVAYSYRGSQCVQHRYFCSSSDLRAEAGLGARYAEVTWEHVGSSWYYLQTLKTTKTKADAEAECESLGAHVLAIETAEEDERFTKLYPAGFWLSLERTGDNWEQRGEPVTYFNWVGLSPTHSYLSEDCVSHTVYGWYTLPCSDTLGFICEK